MNIKLNNDKEASNQSSLGTRSKSELKKPFKNRPNFQTNERKKKSLQGIGSTGLQHPIPKKENPEEMSIEFSNTQDFQPSAPSISEAPIPPSSENSAKIKNPVGLSPPLNENYLPNAPGPNQIPLPKNQIALPNPGLDLMKSLNNPVTVTEKLNQNNFTHPTAFSDSSIPDGFPNIDNPSYFTAPNFFTHPSGFEFDHNIYSFTISVHRVSISDKNLKRAQEDGRFYEILKNHPGVNIFSNNAGKGQAYINIASSDPIQGKSVYDNIKSLDDSDYPQWYFLDNTGEFQPYSESNNYIIENGFINGIDDVLIRGENDMIYSIVYGRDGIAHQQILVNRHIMRTVRRGLDLDASISKNYVLWEWSDEIADEWRCYEPEACGLIENHFNKFVEKFRGKGLITNGNKKRLAKKEAVLVSGTSGFSYLIDFVNMVQINESSRRWRGIRREGMDGTFRVSQVEPEPIPWIDHPVPGID